MYEIISQVVTYLKPYMFFAIVRPLFIVLDAMDLIQPTIMQHIIDVGIATGNRII